MTYVYIVKEGCEYGNNCTQGVFTTEEKAQAFIDSFPEDERMHYEIYKVELQ
ncbi:DUF7336 domain-containing protein [Priestia megaterium]|uniref:DUF7336 domain-containing protein n=1 Tax=Priestia megaterium TaxID=1404 RepID=UPI0015D4D12D|nr:hypothetical protein [Priestia megaterium]